MLQRAANNAYSWWWAGHIRTKQSKWLEQSLQDMEEQTQYVLGLIQEEGDSFAKRAEMYYKRRPELISCVEESYRAFRALAERYDHISRELQNANNTLATCSPERLQMSMGEDDEPGTPPPFPLQVPPANPLDVPKVPNVPFKSLRVASKRLETNEILKESDSDSASKSGLNKSEAEDEIDKLQKDILALQTVKEFVKSSYQNGLKKFNDIENTIIEKQKRVSKLQDEFCVTKVIEDDEARKLMAEAALRSCQETLSRLQETHQKSAREGKDEAQKIEDARQRINSIKHQYLLGETDAEETPSEKDESVIVGNEKQLQEKIQSQFDVSSMSSITVTELAEKIDELVSTVFNLEDSVSSQSVLIERLRTEAYELHANIKTLEDDKSNLNEGTGGLTNKVKDKVKELEDKLRGLQGLNRNFESQSSNLETHFNGAQSILDNLSEKLTSVQPDDDDEEAIAPSQQNEKSLQDMNNLDEDHEKQKVLTSNDSIEIANPFETGDVNAQERSNGQNGEVESPTMNTETSVDPKMENSIERQASTVSELSPRIKDSEEGKDKDELNWQMMLLSGDEDREKIMMKEYMTILKNYKEVKKKLSDMENKNKDGQHDNPRETTELEYAIGKRDEEIHKLRRKLSEIQGNSGENQDESSISDSSNQQKTGVDDDFSFILPGKVEHFSEAEEKLRTDIDSILDENLDFWLRFSTALNQIQKFSTTVEDLQGEITLIREKKQQEDNDIDVKSELRPLYKHMKEIQAELAAWLKNSASLNEELEHRLSSLCTIQEKISVALKESVQEYDIIFSSHQAAKFQGEVLNMKQENNRVKEELQVGYAHIRKLKGEVDRTLTKLIDEFRLFDNQPLGHLSARAKIPLQLFIFGSKPKQKRPSLFSRMQHNMKYQVLKGGVPQ